MTIIDRVKALELPLDHIVVIGSGIMDALGLRNSQDIDLAVSDELFARLREGGIYTERIVHDQIVLECDDVEIWQDWGKALPYEKLRDEGIVLDGVRFCHPSTVLHQKQMRMLPKDQTDIRLLKAYEDKIT